MPAPSTPRSAAQTATAIADTAQNPVQKNTNGSVNVHVHLTFQNRDFDPNALYAALVAAYTNVAGSKETLARGDYHYTIA